MITSVKIIMMACAFGALAPQSRTESTSRSENAGISSTTSVSSLESKLSEAQKELEEVQVEKEAIFFSSNGLVDFPVLRDSLERRKANLAEQQESLQKTLSSLVEPRDEVDIITDKILLDYKEELKISTKAVDWALKNLPSQPYTCQQKAYLEEREGQLYLRKMALREEIKTLLEQIKEARTASEAIETTAR